MDAIKYMKSGCFSSMDSIGLVPFFTVSDTHQGYLNSVGESCIWVEDVKYYVECSHSCSCMITSPFKHGRFPCPRLTFLEANEGRILFEDTRRFSDYRNQCHLHVQPDGFSVIAKGGKLPAGTRWPCYTVLPPSDDEALSHRKWRYKSTSIKGSVSDHALVKKDVPFILHRGALSASVDMMHHADSDSDIPKSSVTDKSKSGALDEAPSRSGTRDEAPLLETIRDAES